MNSDDQQTLEFLKAEVAALQARVAALENQKNPASHMEPAATRRMERFKLFPAKTHPEPGQDSSAPPSSVASTDHNLIEEYIGGRLLNRVGALIVVFAVAYFLKWSFDNQIIGEMGRCILGLVSGIAFMTAGQVCQKRGLRVYARGLIGAGIAIIYLSAFAAVNYYDLISPYIAFALMFITAITGGILAAVDDAPATAIMATIGGFLVPFLMGSHSGKVVPLLSYVLILDLGVLFLAYYRKWLVLDILGLVGTAVISVIAQNMDWQVWPGQAFLTAFLVLFIVVAANYNRRSGNNNHALLIISTLFFSLVSLGNVIDKIPEWRGLFTLAGAAIFLAAYYLPLTARGTTVYFRQVLLALALIFALLTAPLHLNDVYCQIAWLAVAAVLLHISSSFNKKYTFMVSLLIIISVFFSTFEIYQQPHVLPILNQATLVIVLCIVDWFLALMVSSRLYPGKVYLSLGLSVVILSAVFYLVHFDINNAIYYYQANQSFTFLIPVVWALVSSLVLFIGVRRENKAIRLLSLVLYGVVIVRTLFFDLRQLDIVYKILVLLAIGAIALAISFFYQKRMKEEALP